MRGYQASIQRHKYVFNLPKIFLHLRSSLQAEQRKTKQFDEKMFRNIFVRLSSSHVVQGLPNTLESLPNSENNFLKNKDNLLPQ